MVITNDDLYATNHLLSSSILWTSIVHPFTITSRDSLAVMKIF